MKPKNLKPLAVAALRALAVWLGAWWMLNEIDAEQDRAIAACKAPVRRTR